MPSERHLDFVKDFFRVEVWVVTEWRDESVYKTKKIGEIAWRGPWDRPVKPGERGVILSPKPVVHKRKEQ